jgi:hypothetical protein
MAKLLTTYCISITMYLVALYQIWCLYHIYVRKTIRFKILWHHSEPFGSSLGHYFCFFKGARPSFNGLTCCPHLFRMLSFDHSCINIPFPTGWSLYFLDVTTHVEIGIYPFWVALQDTCAMLPKLIWSHVLFWKSNNAMIFSNALFFDGPITQVKIYFISSRCLFRCYASTSILMCRSSSKGLVISLF